MINEFLNDNRFLSNFYTCPVTIWGYTFDNSEAAYHAAKNLEYIEQFVHLSSFEAKRLGRIVPLTSNWESIKNDVMYQVVRAKFSQHIGLKRKLLETGDQELIEGNIWHDNYWGDCYCDKCKNIQGKNVLGKILMKVREELRQEIR